MPKQRGKIGKYSKITLQKKFQLLRLSQCDNLNLKQTSKLLEINYSTAKTILFQYQKNKIKNFLTFQGKRLEKESFKCEEDQIKKIATYKPYNDSEEGKHNVKVYCTSNSQNHQNKQTNVFQMLEEMSKIDKNSIKEIELEKQSILQQQKQSEKKSIIQNNKQKQTQKNQTIMNSINDKDQKGQILIPILRNHHQSIPYFNYQNGYQSFNYMQGLYYIPWIFSNIEYYSNSLIFNS